jgi:hypothetical protein
MLYACVERMAWLGLLCMALGFRKMCKMLRRVDTVGEKLTIPLRVYSGDSERYSIYTLRVITEHWVIYSI